MSMHVLIFVLSFNIINDNILGRTGWYKIGENTDSIIYFTKFYEPIVNS